MRAVEEKVALDLANLDAAYRLHIPNCLRLTQQKTLKRKQEDATEPADQALMITSDLSEPRPGCSQVQVNQEEQQHQQLQQQIQQTVQEFSQLKKGITKMAKKSTRLQQEQQAPLFSQYQGQEAGGAGELQEVTQVDQQQQQEQQLQEEEEVKEEEEKEKEDDENEDKLVRAGKVEYNSL
uniref:Uncharacterized protein n=1 Tax=Plectus sambesii TaxID=2011161 RepID=A0A914UYA5_9BILA